MSEAIKPTPGPMRVQADDKWPFYIRTLDAAGDCVFQEDMPAYSTAQRSLAQCLLGLHMSRDSDGAVRANAVALANAELRADAHNVLTTTGLTPRQLVERVKELEAAAKLVLDWYEAENDHSKADFYQRMQMCRDSEDAIRAALSKSLPNTVAEVK